VSGTSGTSFESSSRTTTQNGIIKALAMNELIDRPPQRADGPARRRRRVGGDLNYYHRSAA
jgi:hypothetical protein